MSDELRQIGDVAEATGFSQRTIRHYEEVGLVVPERTSGGFRLYGEIEIARLRLIKQMKPLGFTLAEMGELIELLEQLSARHFIDAAQLAFLLEQVSRFEEQAKECAERLREQLLAARDLGAELRQICVKTTLEARR